MAAVTVYCRQQKRREAEERRSSDRKDRRSWTASDRGAQLACPTHMAILVTRTCLRGSRKSFPPLWYSGLIFRLIVHSALELTDLWHEEAYKGFLLKQFGWGQMFLSSSGWLILGRTWIRIQLPMGLVLTVSLRSACKGLGFFLLLLWGKFTLFCMWIFFLLTLYGVTDAIPMSCQNVQLAVISWIGAPAVRFLRKEIDCWDENVFCP